jgi:hypothetical protein
MRKSLLLLFFLCLGINLYGQCPTTTVTIITQEDIDNFILDYPNCTVIPTNILIGDSEITNLNGLSHITEIQGNLKIGDENGSDFGTNVINFQGLNNLTTLGGYLFISTNDELVSFSGLESLTSIGGFYS